MIGAPGDAGVTRLRAAEPSDADAIQAVLQASSTHDDPAGRSHGDWSVAAWATHTRVLVRDSHVVGVVAVRDETAPDGAMPVRVALDVSARQAPLATLLVQAGVDLVSASRAQRARLFIPSQAAWIQVAAQAVGFVRVRTIAHMLLPATSPSPELVVGPGVGLRSMRPREDEHVLAALNRAWAGTWNFVPITFDMLERDLDGQREGMLLLVEQDADDHIIATCHAVFEPTDENPDGSPRAWISNVTVDPEFRGRGLSRTILAAGIQNLRSRGARSITLGVDADNPAPFGLYQSVGFKVDAAYEAWDTALETD